MTPVPRPYRDRPAAQRALDEAVARARAAGRELQRALADGIHSQRAERARAEYEHAFEVTYHAARHLAVVDRLLAVDAIILGDRAA